MKLLARVVRCRLSGLDQQKSREPASWFAAGALTYLENDGVGDSHEPAQAARSWPDVGDLRGQALRHGVLLVRKAPEAPAGAHLPSVDPHPVGTPPDLARAPIAPTASSIRPTEAAVKAMALGHGRLCDVDATMTANVG